MKQLTSISVLVNADETAVEVSTSASRLKMQTCYCLTLAQPCPVAGYNLPVNIVVNLEDGSTVTQPLKMYNRMCNVEFGQDLPRCRNRLPLYYTNGGDFIDLRKVCK